MNHFQKTVNQQNKVDEYLSVINHRLGLTPSQLKVLSCLINVEFPIFHLDGDDRKFIMEKTGVGYCNLSTYLTLFRSKGILERQGKNWMISPKYKPYFDNGKCDILITLNIE
jgi:hypothetical protein